MTSQTGGNGTKKVEIMVSLRYLSIFGRTLKMPLTVKLIVKLILL